MPFSQAVTGASRDNARCGFWHPGHMELTIAHVSEAWEPSPSHLKTSACRHPLQWGFQRLLEEPGSQLIAGQQAVLVKRLSCS